MDKVLFYLYSLSPYDGRSNAEANIGQQCRITVILTNGDTRVYRQRDGQYLSVDESPWQRIDPEKSCRLFPLLARMCSDEEQQNFRLSG